MDSGSHRLRTRLVEDASRFKQPRQLSKVDHVDHVDNVEFGNPKITRFKSWTLRLSISKLQTK